MQTLHSEDSQTHPIFPLNLRNPCWAVFFLISNFLSFLQFEAASKQYQFVPSPSEASRCLEQAGMFRKAIAILEDSHFYDRAIDCLRRYQIKIEVIIITSIYLHIDCYKKGFLIWLSYHFDLLQKCALHIWSLAQTL